MGFEMREITQVGPTCHQKSPYTREAEGDLAPHTVEKERQSRVMWPQAESPEAGRGKEPLVSSSLWRELYLNPDLDPVTLIVNFWPPELRTHFCCSKSPS